MILNYSNNWELLVAVMLSAQCTDKMVNKVTEKLFPKYRTMSSRKTQVVIPAKAGIQLDPRVKPEDDNKKITASLASLSPRNDNAEVREIVNFAEVPITELEQDIRSTGFYHNKAKNIQATAKMILEKFHGEIPQTMTELITLPGVARKTTNIVLGNAYKIYEGVAVDTHVSRLSQRLGLSKHTNPEKIEQDLMQLFDKKDWFNLTYLLIDTSFALR